MGHRVQDVDDYHSGDSLTLQVDVIDGDGGVVDITDADVVWKLFSGSGSGSVITKDNDSGGGISITSAGDGEFEINIDPSDTEDLAGAYHHECELTDQNGDKSTIFTGKFRIEDDSIE